MLRLTATTAIAASLFLAGCAQQEEPDAPVIRGEPTYDKYGSINGCEEGRYIPGAAPVDQCLPPEDCEPTIGADGQTIPCPPPMRNPNDVLEGDDPERRPNATVGTLSSVPG